MKQIFLSLLVFSGTLFILIASVGLIRFRDLYSRMHATTKASSFGLMLILIGVALFFNLWPVYLKSLLVIAFVYLTAPLASHAVAQSQKGREDDGEGNAARVKKNG
ncbi:MAG TPA: cation:proton antiporter [Bacteroidetes bacterium]|nr:cation:proton antiporter [Bacteroidota bacterium]